jgi:hypothetical protein
MAQVMVLDGSVSRSTGVELRSDGCCLANVRDAGRIKKDQIEVVKKWRDEPGRSAELTAEQV